MHRYDGEDSKGSQVVEGLHGDGVGFEIPNGKDHQGLSWSDIL